MFKRDNIYRMLLVIILQVNIMQMVTNQMVCKDNGKGGKVCHNVKVIVEPRKCADTTCTSASAA